MSLAYCFVCLNRIDDCQCEDGPHGPFIYGEIARAIAIDKRTQKTSNAIGSVQVKGIYSEKIWEKTKD